tara:strand:- start:639 stop:1142 length:504 start_codon:yes stop_codon:yes gene_type:complete
MNPMNRREFTTSMAALAAAPALPLPAAAPRTAAQIPTGTYAWGQLIARAQNTCNPAMLARHLRLDADVAHALFDTMLRDGVLRAPDIAGLARAAQPLDPTGTGLRPGGLLRRKAKTLIADIQDREERSDDPDPLVNDNSKGLGCDQPTKEAADARTDQPVQESPARG